MPGTIRRVTTAGSLYRLIYRSRQVIAHVVPDAATEAGLQRQLRTIVSAARFHNKAANITGALLFTGAGFVQVLEGAREVVERTFDRIAEDHRHTDVTVLSFTPALQRSFPDWPMGFCGQALPGPGESLADASCGYFPPGFPSEVGVLPGARVATGSDVLRLLERVVQKEDVWVGV
jgi:hypothetical protein